MRRVGRARLRFERDPHLQLERPGGTHDGGQVVARLVVHGDAIAARLCDRLEVLLRPFGHQVAVDECAGVVDRGRDRLEDDRADRHRLDEVPVADVEMEDAHAGAEQHVDLVAEVREVCGIERRLDLDRANPLRPAHDRDSTLRAGR